MESIPRMRPLDLPSMHEELQARLREYIMANNLQPEDRLPTEAQLAEQLGVSRTAVREGLRSLESLGLIYSRRGEGRFVRDFNLDPILDNLHYSMLYDAEDLLQMIDVRARLEVGFISDAVAAMDASTLAELHGLVGEIRLRATSGPDRLDKDLAFHAAIYRPLNNRVLDKLLAVFCTIYKNLRDQTLLTAADPTKEVENHVAILAAIEARDAEKAQRLIIDHFTGIKERACAAVNVNVSSRPG